MKTLLSRAGNSPFLGLTYFDFHPPAAVNYCNLMPRDTGTLWVCPFWNGIILEEVSVCLSPLSQPLNLWGSLGIKFWVGAQQKGDRGRRELGIFSAASVGALGLGTAKRGWTTSPGLVVVSLPLRDLFLWHTVGYLATDLPDLGSVFYSELFVFPFVNSMSFLIEENCENNKQAEKGGPNLVSHLT